MAANDPIDIRLLGNLTVQHSGRRIQVPTRKAAGLLAVLALHPGTRVSRERLGALLWSRSAPAQARASLRQALTQLRRTLETGDAELLEADGDGIRLRAGVVRTDAADLQAALESADPAALARAATLYRGDLLADFTLDESPFEDWRRIEAERLRRCTLQSLGRLLSQQVQMGEVEAALGLGERLLELDPASEEVHQALIRLDLERGALGSAMRRYERCRAALAAGLGVPPSSATEELRRRIHARPVTVHDAGAPPLIAVLPFTNRSPDPARGYIALGFAEEVIRALSRFRSLRVMAARSSFAAAEAGTAPQEAAARLGARYVLAGSLSPGADSLRIGSELLDADSGHCLWSERYDVGLGEVLAAQDDIARAVAAALAVRIDGDLLKQAARKPLDSLEAYDCWLRGIALLRLGTPESLPEARPLFQRALALDPSFARAYTGLSLSHFNEWSCVAWQRWDENERRAYEYAEQGARMDDTDHMTHFVLGRILLYRREFERAERHLFRAEALNPNDADMLAQMGFSDACLGDADRGAARVQLARRLNPFHDDWYFAFAAGTHLLARRLEDAIACARSAPLAATDMHAYLACAYSHLGELAEARRHLEAFLDLFRRRITFGRLPEPDEPARWLLHVNPLRRDEDADFVMSGLARAGMTMPSGLSSPSD